MYRVPGQGLRVSHESVGVGIWHSLQEQADHKGDASCGGSTLMHQVLRWSGQGAEGRTCQILDDSLFVVV